MKRIHTVLFLVISPFISYAQSNVQKFMETNSYKYSNWKIKKGDKLGTNEGDSITVSKMQWYVVDGEQIVFADVVSNGDTQQIDLKDWIDQDRIKLPENVIKLAVNANANNTSPIGSDGSLTTEIGYKISPGHDIKLGTGTLPNGDFKYIFFSRSNWLTMGDPMTYVPSVWMVTFLE